MFDLGNLSISKKLAFAFGIVCALCTLQSVFGVYGIVKLNRAISEIENDTIPSVQLVNTISMALTQVRRTDLALALCDNSACTSRAIANREKSLQKYKSATEKYEPLISGPGERELYDTFRKKFSDYEPVSRQAFEASKAGQMAVARALLIAPGAGGAINEAQVAADRDVELNAMWGREQGERTLHTGHELIMTILCLGGLILIMCAATGTTLTRIIAPALRAATAALERVAAKDLTVSVEARGSDEIGRMGAALNTSVASMRDVLRMVAQGAENLSAAAAQMSSRSIEAHGNAESQAGKTSQIAAAATEMTATIREISQNAETAASASRSSAEIANEGGEVMQTTASTM